MARQPGRARLRGRTQIPASADAELAQQRGDVHRHRLRADEKCRRNVAIRRAGHHLGQNLAFPWGQAVRDRCGESPGGWQLNGVVQGQTGFPTTVFDPSLSIRFLTNRPNQVCDPNADAPGTIDLWFDTTCFVRRSLPETGEPGSTPRNSVRGPGFVRTDLSLFKNVPLTGTHRVQFRVEAFNLFNQARFGQPGNQIGTANFGRITSADDGRIIQLAVKYNF